MKKIKKIESSGRFVFCRSQECCPEAGEQSLAEPTGKGPLLAGVPAEEGLCTIPTSLKPPPLLPQPRFLFYGKGHVQKETTAHS